MRYILLILSIVFTRDCWSQNPFHLSVVTLQGDTISLSSFEGKKILFVGINPGAFEAAHIQRIDSLFRHEEHRLVVVGLPLSDLAANISDSSLTQLLRTDLGVSFVIAKQMPGSRFSSGQHPLAKWLTIARENGHFGNDLKEDGQIFLLNEQGNLYGVFHKSTPWSTIVMAVNKAFN